MRLESLTLEQLNKLKSKTKKQVMEIQSLKEQEGSTLETTATFLGLGGVTFFLQPTMCAFFLSSYLLLLQIDFLKSLVAIRLGKDPLWKWKMRDCGYVMGTTFGILTVLFLTKQGIAKLKERAVQRALVTKGVIPPEI